MALETPYSLALLSEYTHTLDSLPIDLSRNFADLRELDAVLSSSIVSITSKIQTLTDMIEQGTASKEDRLWLLTEIAEEAHRLKLGGEDKIRVACQAADNLKAHSNHLRVLTEHLPGFDPSVLERRTVYPHISERSFLPAASMETGRRRRGAVGSLMATNPEPSPAKRKRVARDDDIDIGTMRTPKKLPGTESNPRSRNNARAKKTDRAASPSESLVSVTSHLPQAVGHSTSGRGGSANNARAGGASSSTNKRARAGANNSHNPNPTPLANEPYPPLDLHQNTHASNSRRGAVNELYNVPPSAAHPSLPLPYQNGASNGVSAGYEMHGIPHNLPGTQDWNLPHTQQLEGPGMPVARSASIHSTAANVNALAGNVDATDGGEGDGDGDDRTYCFCDRVSYGEMIACDDMQCEREWFHLACIGLTVPPDGTWYCKACEAKRNAKKTGRGGKRKAGGGRGNAKGG